ncbi:hypothetical protein FA15DRAFT_755679 [Coprinopsis marcescibilis]|uniref:DUF6535 domain-containing protein n=1 Tax=Coprinopsis marcescibilis TaxID=230819 RepID=A0A5C3KYW6_COPMA|nr:hypothetical protein FA15DRAFT_755679 [Coprinopsis marcescibilis]
MTSPALISGDPDLENGIVTRRQTLLNRICQHLSPEATHNLRVFYPQHSPIWNLYIKDAAEQAKIHADRLNTTLDSLLIFAGLFAGVVASFVIESRAELVVAGSNGSNIGGGETGETTTSPTQPSNIILWVNGLWFTSLLFTLFNAIVGGVAKAWLVKYASTTSRQDADAAYQRWMLDLRGQQWQLDTVIGFVPLIVHLALFLFGVGFGLRTLQDNADLGRFVLAFLALATAIYVGMTLPALLLPERSSPLQTPLSDIINGILRPPLNFISKHRHANSNGFAKDNTGTHNPPPPEPLGQVDFPPNATEKEKILGKVWCEMITTSRNSALVDKAIEELNTLEPTDRNDQWLEYFARNGVVKKSLSRLEECMQHRSGFQDEESRTQVIAHHLRSLLNFKRWAQTADSEVANQLFYAPLEQSCFSQGQSLHLWNFFPKPARPLAFALRVFIHLHSGRDIRPDEVEDLPWETMVKHLGRSNHLPFTLMACHGLSKSPKHRYLPELSAFSIAYSIVDSAKNGSLSEWERSDDNNELTSTSLGQRVVKCLFRNLVSYWEQKVKDGVKSSPINHHDISGCSQDFKAASVSGIPDSLASALTHDNSKIRSHAIHTVAALSPFSNELPIARVFERAIEDHSSYVRSEAVKCLKQLVESNVINYHELASFRQMIHHLFHEQAETDTMLRVLKHLRELFEHVPHLEIVVKDEIDRFIQLMVSFPDRDMLTEVTELIKILHRDHELAHLRDKVTYQVNAIHNENRNNMGLLQALPQLFPFIHATDMLNLVKSHVVPIAVHDHKAVNRASGIYVLIDILKLMSTREKVEQVTNPHSSTIPAAVQAEIETLFKRPVKSADLITDSLMGLKELVDVRDVFLGVLMKLVPVFLEVFESSDSVLDVKIGIVKAFVEVAKKGDPKSLATVEGREIYPRKLPRDHFRVRKVLVKLLGCLALDGKSTPALCRLMEVSILDPDETIRSRALNCINDVTSSDSFSPDHAVEKKLGEIQGALLESDMASPSVTVFLDLFVVIAQSSAFESFTADLLRKVLQKMTPPTDDIQDKKSQSIKFPGVLVMSFYGSNSKDWKARVNATKILRISAQLQEMRSGSGTFSSSPSEVEHLISMVFNDVSVEVHASALAAVASLRVAGLDPALDVLKPKDLPKRMGDDWTNAPQVRQVWIRLLVTFSCRLGISDVTRLIYHLATNDDDTTVRCKAVKALNSLQSEHGEIAKSLIISMISKKSNSVLKDSSPAVCVQWIHLTAAFLKNACDDYLWLSDIVEATFQFEDEDGRDQAIKLLKEGGMVTLQAKLTKSVTEKLEHALQSADFRIRRRSLCTLKIMCFERNPSSQPFREMAEIILPKLIPCILKIALEDRDRTARADAEGLTLRLIHKVERASNEGPAIDIGTEILLALPSFIEAVTDDNRKSFLQFAEKVDMSGHQEKIAIAGRAAAHCLIQKSAYSRTTAIKFLLILHKKCDGNHSAATFMDSTIMDIVGMALDDKDDQLREDALHFVIKICSDATYLKRIKGVRPRLMELLEIGSLRTSAVELISLLADHPDVRTRLASWMFSIFLSDDPQQKHVEPAVELLARLIMDGKLDPAHEKSGPLDSTMLLLATVVMMRPSFANFRFHISTALWLNYDDVADKVFAGSSKDLVKWFLFMVLGHHPTTKEVDSWLEMDLVFPE